jgi:small subunit ribosomal protein S8
MTDPIADMLTRIRNAGFARLEETSCPFSQLKLAIAKLLNEEGFLTSVRVEPRDRHPVLVIGIRFDEDGDAFIDGIRRVSKPSRRVYVGKDDIPMVRAGMGVAVMSTSKGIVSDRAAREASMGGEVLCEVW